MTKEQSYEALLTKVYVFGAIGMALATIVAVFTLVVGSAPEFILAHLPAPIVWTVVVFAVSAIVLLLIAVRYKLASVKLMREVVDEL